MRQFQPTTNTHHGKARLGDFYPYGASRLETSISTAKMEGHWFMLHVVDRPEHYGSRRHCVQEEA